MGKGDRDVKGETQTLWVLELKQNIKWNKHKNQHDDVTCNLLVYFILNFDSRQDLDSRSIPGRCFLSSSSSLSFTRMLLILMNLSKFLAALLAHSARFFDFWFLSVYGFDFDWVVTHLMWNRDDRDKFQIARWDETNEIWEINRLMRMTNLMYFYHLQVTWKF